MFEPELFRASARESGLVASITMVTFNRWGCTRQSLISVFENTHLPYTLTVVDNGSWDGTTTSLKRLRRKGDIDRLILLPKNRGIAIGKNFGLKASEGEAAWYCCIDNDIKVGSHWLSYLCYASMLEGLGVVGSNVQGFGLPGRSQIYKPKLWKEVEGVLLDTCPNPGGLYVMSAATFKKLGYFIERSLYGLEDSELYWRQFRHGLKSAYVRNALCRELPDEKFTMKSGITYRTFKTAAHGAILAEVRELNKRGRLEAIKHYETEVTAQEIEEFTWEAA